MSGGTVAEAAARYAECSRRYMVLGECLTMREALRRSFSRNEAAQSPKDGYEAAFQEEGARIELIRQMMRELRSEMDRSMVRIAEIRKGED